MDIMRQSACLVVNPITVYSFVFLFNFTTVGQALDVKLLVGACTCNDTVPPLELNIFCALTITDSRAKV